MGNFRQKSKKLFLRFMGEKFRDATPLGSQSPLKYAVWCKNDGDTPKNVFSRACKKSANKKFKK